MKRAEDSQFDPKAEMNRMSRRSFLWSAFAVGGSYVAWKWINSQPLEGGLVAPLRRSLEFNQGFVEATYGIGRLSPEFPASSMQPIRTNGAVGTRKELTEAASWKLRLDTADGVQTISMKELLELPIHEYVTQLRCVEGWSRVNRFEGFRISEFLAKFAPRTVLPFMALETPGAEYYVGLERESFMHPQAMLCIAMNGEPLRPENGAPLRLALPIKYGYKQLKNVGIIQLLNTQPRDYWAERGYDWFAGL